VRIIWANRALADYHYWERTDPKVCTRIKKLIDDIVDRDPSSGIGKPEPLRYKRKGDWSRRITDEHRLVYRVEGKPAVLTILQCRYHYE
jgi:toxin YoeB